MRTQGTNGGTAELSRRDGGKERGIDRGKEKKTRQWQGSSDEGKVSNNSPSVITTSAPIILCPYNITHTLPVDANATML